MGGQLKPTSIIVTLILAFLSLCAINMSLSSASVITIRQQDQQILANPQHRKLHVSSSKDIQDLDDSGIGSAKKRSDLHDVKHSPCRESVDTRFGGILVNCSNMNLKEIDPGWFPVNATTVLLDKNDIHTLCNDTFLNLKHLRVLSIRSSKVSRIQVNALRGLNSLEQLDMEYNSLTLWENAFPFGMFDYVHNLLQLFIAFNNVETNNIIDSKPPDATLRSATSPYPDHIDIFDHLPNLQSLSIDTFPEDLYLGPEFEKFPNLTSLVLFCGASTKVHNDSLIGLANVTLRHLEIREFVKKDLYFDSGVFQYLSHLDSLTVHQCQIGNHNILRALWPFQNKTMSSLILHGTNYPHHWVPPIIVFQDGIINQSIVNPMKSICVAKFAWTSSRLYAVEPESLSSPTWIRCLVSIDFTSNPLDLSGWQSLIYVTTRCKLLQEVILLMPDDTPTHPNTNAWLQYKLGEEDNMSCQTITGENEISVSSSSESERQDNINYNTTDRTTTTPTIIGTEKNKFNTNIASRKEEQPEGVMGDRDRVVGLNDFRIINTDKIHGNMAWTDTTDGYDSKEVTNQMGKGYATHLQSGADNATSDKDTSKPSAATANQMELERTRHPPYQALATAEMLQEKYNQSLSSLLPLLTIRLPRALKSIQLDGANKHNFLHMARNIYIANGDVLEEIIARNMPMFIYGSKRLMGCVNLKTADFTNTLMDVEDFFWDDFSSYEVLIISSIKPASFFERITCKRLIRNMPNLRHLDISNNHLNLLSQNTFSSAHKLQYLSLAKNRFSNIPFDLKTTPNLEVLDITENAILFLTETEMVAIDTHVAGGKSFTLKLQGNGIVCVCSRIRFLAWQQTTLAHFDNDGNYSCTSEDGQVAFTKDFGNILGFWRQCEGRFMFMVSLVLGSLLAVAMLTACLMTRFHTAMVAFFLRIVAPHFRPWTISDYTTGVFVGYADDDYRFVRFKLQGYLEDGLKVSTFIHQRDMGAGYKDQLFYEAIQNSWRILLVITDNFLHNYDVANIIMKYASYSVSPVNRERVFVLVEEAQLHNIPDFLHDVLDDTKIIPLHDMDAPLDYHQKQAIKNSVLPR